MYVSGYPSGFFGNTSSTNSLNSLFAGASYYKLASQYAIKQKYGHSTATNPSTSKTANSASTTSKKTSTSKEATDFLTNYTSNYTSLKSATSNLKTKINDDSSTTDDKVAAVQDYVKAYNKTLTYMDEHSGSNTYAINRLKGSLDAITSINNSVASGIGISKNSDGTLSVDKTQLTSAFTNNATSTKRSLSSLAGITEAHTTMASNTSNAQLLKEQNLLATKTNNSSKSTNDASYNDFMALASNSMALKNYYYGLACSGTFMDIGI